MAEPPVTPNARVLVLYTGGTIGMVPRDPADPHSPLAPAPKERLAAYVANPLDGIAWELRGLEDECGQAAEPLDSASIGPRHWGWMARAVARAYDDFDGFVILHGTDTMAFSASALAFMLHNLAKPVVFTGAQHPIHEPRSDAPGNFANALRVAAHRDISEVVLCFGDRLLRGCRATKVSTISSRGFDSPNEPPLGHLGAQVVVDRARLRPPPGAGSPFHADGPPLDGAVIPVLLYPGMGGGDLRRQLAAEGARGFILRAFGAGNTPLTADFLAAIAEATARGQVVVATTQCLEGAVAMGTYESSAALAACGVIGGGDMTFEAALTKLMWLLSRGDGAVPALMAADLRGELSEGTSTSV